MRKQSEVDKDMRKEKIKECVKDLKTIQRNLKKIYTLVYRNCVQTVIKANEEFEEKLKVFDHEWLFTKVKTTLSGLDTKVKLCVSETAGVQMEQWMSNKI